MKKVFWVCVLVALMVGPALANPQVVGVGGRMVWVETVTGNVAGNAEIVIARERPNFFRVAGRYLYEVITVPGVGAVQPNAWTGSVDDALGRELVEIPLRSDTDTETIEGYATLGYYPPITNSWTVTLTGIGQDNQVTVYLVFD